MAQGSRSSRNELSRTINIHSPSKEMIIARTMSNSRQCPTLIRFHSIVVRLYHTLGFWSVQLVGFSLEQNTGSSVFQVGNQGCTRSSQLEMKIFLVAPCPGIGTPYPIFFRTRLIYCILDMSPIVQDPFLYGHGWLQTLYDSILPACHGAGFWKPPDNRSSQTRRISTVIDGVMDLPLTRRCSGVQAMEIGTGRIRGLGYPRPYQWLTMYI